jgi:UDP-N-acetylglucosamine diphosphorylase/glucosamine-1-phosphate N-acetyltransferase
MRVCLFEDAQVAALEPLALSRPAFELRSGLTTLADKQRRLFESISLGVLIRPHLVPLCASCHPASAVNDLEWLRAGPAVFVNARWLPPLKVVHFNDPALFTSGPHVGILDGEVAYAVLTLDELENVTPEQLDDHLADWKRSLPHRSASGRLIRYLWELVDLNGEQIASDFLAARNLEQTAGRPATLTLVGRSDWLRVDPTARIDPFVVADTTNGPVIIDRDAVVTSFTRLEGPCYIGPRTQLFGANIRGGTTIGPNCRIGGEVECSIIQGHANKYHDGFLGHSYLGEWVNLGAGTHTSDLRNDYGEVSVTVNAAHVPTGRSKVGSFIGDHSKTGLGTLLNTGTNIGAFCQLLPSGELLPRHVPSFCSVAHGWLEDTDELAPLFVTGAKAMERRGEEFTAAHEALFEELFEMTEASRRLAIREDQKRRLRRSA